MIDLSRHLVFVKVGVVNLLKTCASKVSIPFACHYTTQVVY